MADNLDRFTKHARQALQIAQEEAVRLNHNYVGTEHLLSGLVKEDNGLAAHVLREVGALGPDFVRRSNGWPLATRGPLWPTYPHATHQAGP